MTHFDSFTREDLHLSVDQTIDAILSRIEHHLNKSPWIGTFKSMKSKILGRYLGAVFLFSCCS